MRVSTNWRLAIKIRFERKIGFHKILLLRRRQFSPKTFFPLSLRLSLSLSRCQSNEFRWSSTGIVVMSSFVLFGHRRNIDINFSIFIVFVEKMFFVASTTIINVKRRNQYVVRAIKQNNNTKRKKCRIESNRIHSPTLFSLLHHHRLWLLV